MVCDLEASELAGVLQGAEDRAFQLIGKIDLPGGSVIEPDPDSMVVQVARFDDVQMECMPLENHVEGAAGELTLHRP